MSRLWIDAWKKYFLAMPILHCVISIDYVLWPSLFVESRSQTWKRSITTVITNVCGWKCFLYVVELIFIFCTDAAKCLKYFGYSLPFRRICPSTSPGCTSLLLANKSSKLVFPPPLGPRMAFSPGSNTPLTSRRIFFSFFLQKLPLVVSYFRWRKEITLRLDLILFVLEST